MTLRFLTARGPLAALAAQRDASVTVLVELYSPPNAATRSFLSTALNRATRAYVSALEDGAELTGSAFGTTQTLKGVSGGIADELATASRVAVEGLTEAAGWKKTRTSQTVPAKARTIAGGHEATSSNKDEAMEVSWGQAAADNAAPVKLSVSPNDVVVVKAKLLGGSASASDTLQPPVFMAILLPEMFTAPPHPGQAHAPAQQAPATAATDEETVLSPAAARVDVTSASASFFLLGTDNNNNSSSNASPASSAKGASSTSAFPPPVFTSQRFWHLLASSAPSSSAGGGIDGGAATTLHSQLLTSVELLSPSSAASDASSSSSLQPQQQLVPRPPAARKPAAAAAPAAAAQTVVTDVAVVPASAAPSSSSSSSSIPLLEASVFGSSANPAVSVLAHKHTVYCDRKRQVCTADGAVRQGNRLSFCSSFAAAASSPDALPAGLASLLSAAPAGRRRRWVVTWYRSPPSSSFAEFAAEYRAQLSAGAIGKHSELKTDAAAASSIALLTAVAAPSADLLVGGSGSSALTIDDLSFSPVPYASRTLSSIFPLPSNPAFTATAVATIVKEESVPSAAADGSNCGCGYHAQRSLEQLEMAYLAAAQSPDGFPSDSSPLYSNAAALRLLRTEAAATLLDPHGTQHYLTLDDVGCSFLAVLTVYEEEQGDSSNAEGATAGGERTAVVGRWRSLPIGPVEAGPPRIREMWLRGEPVVIGGAGRLEAACWYWGGLPSSLTLFSWVKVDAEGNRTDTAELHQHPFAPFEPKGAGSGSGSDPRVMLLDASCVGAMFKATADPARLDGVRGAPTTSKPCSEITVKEEQEEEKKDKEREREEEKQEAPAAAVPAVPAVVDLGTGDTAVDGDGSTSSNHHHQRSLVLPHLGSGHAVAFAAAPAQRRTSHAPGR